MKSTRFRAVPSANLESGKYGLQNRLVEDCKDKQQLWPRRRLDKRHRSLFSGSATTENDLAEGASDLTLQDLPQPSNHGTVPESRYVWRKVAIGENPQEGPRYVERPCMCTKAEWLEPTISAAL